MTTHDFLHDTTVLLKRSLRHILRSPDTIITTAVTPIAMLLLFVYVFGGAIDVGGGSYVDYLLPGILLITVASGIAYTAFRLFTDVSGGIFERFQSMPIARSAVLWGHVLTSVVANLISLVLVVLVALAMGFRSGAGVLAWLAVLGILVLFTLALTWLAVIPGLTAKSVDGVSGFSYPLIFLPFISSAFVPTAGMPGPVRWFAEHQPVTSIVEHASATCSPSSRSATTAGSPSAGASACCSSPTRSRCAPTAARSPDRTQDLATMPQNGHADDQPARVVRRRDGARGAPLPRQGAAARARARPLRLPALRRGRGGRARQDPHPGRRRRAAVAGA